MDDELASIQSNGTWELGALPAGHRAIGLKWVFKVKKDPAGNVTKYKARLVAKGYAQRQGVNFDEVFAPVARMETMRLLLALAAHNGWQVHHMDVKSAFLKGRSRGGGLRASAARLRQLRQRAQGAPAALGPVWAPAGAARLERQAGSVSRVARVRA